jgi:hypothetical protein
MADPKVGTGKKPKGSGRRLYTDENQKIPSILSLPQKQTQEQQLRRLKESINLMRERYKYLQSVSKEQK